MLSFEIAKIFASGLDMVMFRPHAYLDPGTGSFILQLLLASLVGVGFFFRSYWMKLINKFRKPGASAEEEDEHADNE